MKDDLISRKAALELLGEPHPLDYNAIANVQKIIALPSVPAVPLDKLCEWLAAENVSVPCHLCDHYENGRCSVENDMKTPCPAGTDEWRKVLEKGREVEK